MFAIIMIPNKGNFLEKLPVNFVRIYYNDVLEK